MKMILAVCVLMLLLVGGCGKPVEKPSSLVDPVALAQDALKQMLILYPPAKSKLRLTQAADDAFGGNLLLALREQGYAVMEYIPPAKGGKKAVAESPTDGVTGFDLFYYLDDDGKEIRLTLRIGMERLSRLYARQETSDATTYVPLGAWTRME